MVCLLNSITYDETKSKIARNPRFDLHSILVNALVKTDFTVRVSKSHWPNTVDPWKKKTIQKVLIFESMLYIQNKSIKFLTSTVKRLARTTESKPLKKKGNHFSTSGTSNYSSSLDVKLERGESIYSWCYFQHRTRNIPWHVMG